MTIMVIISGVPIFRIFTVKHVYLNSTIETGSFFFQCVLSSIIVVALRSLLLQVLELPKIWRTSKYDFVSTWKYIVNSRYLDFGYLE